MNKLFLPLQFWLAATIPFTLAVAPLLLIEMPVAKLIILSLAPIVFAISFILTSGILARTGLKGIQEGKFIRADSDPTYRIRRRYTSMWTFVYYFRPLYFLILAIPPLKWLTFRIFGYHGNLDFVVYPDTWLRDIPLLKIEKGAYLSNKSSIATNICLMDGKILVEGIQIGEKACIGHNTLIGPGTKVGSHTEIDASTTSGLRVHYGKNVKVGELCGIQHGVRIEDGVIIEAVCVIGLRCRIGAGVKIVEGSHIHTGTRLRTQAEADEFFSNETGTMSRSRELALGRLTSQIVSSDKPIRTVNHGDRIDSAKLKNDIT